MFAPRLVAATDDETLLPERWRKKATRAGLSQTRFGLQADVFLTAGV